MLLEKLYSTEVIITSAALVSTTELRFQESSGSLPQAWNLYKRSEASFITLEPNTICRLCMYCMYVRMYVCMCQ